MHAPQRLPMVPPPARRDPATLRNPTFRRARARSDVASICERGREGRLGHQQRQGTGPLFNLAPVLAPPVLTISLSIPFFYSIHVASTPSLRRTSRGRRHLANQRARAASGHRCERHEAVRRAMGPARPGAPYIAAQCLGFPWTLVPSPWRSAHHLPALHRRRPCAATCARPCMLPCAPCPSSRTSAMRFPVRC